MTIIISNNNKEKQVPGHPNGNKISNIYIYNEMDTGFQKERK